MKAPINWTRVTDQTEIRRKLNSVAGCCLTTEFSEGQLKTVTFVGDTNEPLLRLWYESYGGIYVQQPEPPETKPAIVLCLHKGKYTADRTIVFNRDDSTYVKEDILRSAIKVLLEEAEDFCDYTTRSQLAMMNPVNYFNLHPEEEEVYLTEGDWTLSAMYIEVFADSIIDEPKPVKRF